MDFMRKWFPFFLASVCYAYNGCLHQRSACLRNGECRTYLDNFESTCGFSSTSCNVSSSSDCVYTLWRIRDFFPYNACVCYEVLGFSEQCNQFRELIWNHPCERQMSDVSEERQAKEKPLHLNLSRTGNNPQRRTTRTPLSDQIQQLRTSLDRDLNISTREVFGRITCNAALNDVCLRHVSCRQLWRLFRSSCGVDQDNRCIMTNREACWQSFEGLSWTGLGNCQCDSSNSDCHWIRLHTKYNKCIHEILKSKSNVASAGSDSVYRLNSHYQPSKINMQNNWRNKWQIAATATALPILSTTTRTTTRSVITIATTEESTPTTAATNSISSQSAKGDSMSLKTTAIYEAQGGAMLTKEKLPWSRVWNESQLNLKTNIRSSGLHTTVSVPAHHAVHEQRHVATQIPADVHYRPLLESQLKTTPAYYYYYTTIVPGSDSHHYSTMKQTEKYQHGSSETDDNQHPIWQQTFPAKNESNVWQPKQMLQINPKLNVSQQLNQLQSTQASPTSFTQTEYSVRSSCQHSIARCEAANECRWHLGELRVRCASSSCRRTECAASLQRFARFVPFSLVESMMFCHCSVGDSLCVQQQEIIYPKCLYLTSSTAITCTEAMQKCNQDYRCRHLRYSLETNCPVAHEACAKTSLDECRRSILQARASILEQPCYCPLSDFTCTTYQRMMIPNNPCIEKAMLDYSTLLGYNTMTAVKTESIETNRISETIEQSNAEGVRSPQQARIVVDGQGVIKSGANGYTGDRTTIYRGKAQADNSTSLNTQRERLKVDKWSRLSAARESWMLEHIKTSPIKTTTLSPLSSTYGRSYQGNTDGRRNGRPRTTISPMSTELPPPWVTTTEKSSTTASTYFTRAPLPAEGCNAKDASGRNIFFHIGSAIRKYVDWSSRCSSWCECIAKDKLVCESLSCLKEGNCEAPLTTVDFGERLFLRDRGACFCESGTFICDLPEEMPEFYAGLYLSVGYSTADVDMLRSEIPHDVLERIGFLSSNAANDIANRLQFFFERLLPEDLKCRIVLMPELSEPGSAIMRIEWYGKNEALNHTRTQWHSGWAEKICSPYAYKLADHFSLGESPRFQLVLSTVKQLKVLDYLNGLPSSTSNVDYFVLTFVSLFIVLV